MTQQALWHETFEDALTDLVSALGGPKRVGSALWPVLPVEDAARKLAHCLDRNKSNKLSPDELLVILTMGREAHCHLAVTFLNRATGYADPVPVDPESEVQRLQREFIAAVGSCQKIAKGIESAQLRLAEARSKG